MAPPALVVMGVSGCGKSTVAALLAARLGYAMVEGDSLHPPENVAKMRAGAPLDDADRWPWLERVGEALRGDRVVVTCSALKRAYRDRLRAARPEVVFVYLKGSRELFGARVAARKHEYMPASLLESQFAALEEPQADEAAVIVDAALAPEREAEDALRAVSLRH